MSMTATWALPDHSRTYPPARPPEPEDRLIERILVCPSSTLGAAGRPYPRYAATRLMSEKFRNGHSRS